MSHLLEVIFSGRHKTGKLDLEAVETATRSAMHRAGAAVLSELLSCSEAAPRQVPCARGAQAPYHDARPKQLTTVVGAVCFEREPTTAARTVIGDRVRATGNWMWRGPSARLACAA